jgi:stress-induced morphogen
MSHMTPEQMKERLGLAYPDSSVEVVDLTGTHDHYEVTVESKAFQGLSRVQQHQHVMAVFGPELKTGEVHALSIKTKLKE